MTFDQFITKYNGRYLDFDGRFGTQCMDLFRAYLKEVLGLDPYIFPAVSYAKQVFQNFTTSKYFTKIYNGKTNAPKKGDIVFWGYYLGTTGWAGHVAVCMTADAMNLITFDQNWPTNSPCHFQKHNYRGVMGWLSLK